jgi:hypothetical protein
MNVKVDKKEDKSPELPSPFKKVLLEGLGVGKDRLSLRLDFYTEAIVMQTFNNAEGSFRMISPHDLVKSLAQELPFSSGLLPENVLWWMHDKEGAVTAIWVEPGIKRLALQLDYKKPPKRYDVPLPGLIFLCRPASPPRVYAAYNRPRGLKDKVYKAPLANVYNDGRSCPGTNNYPQNVGGIPDSFFKSFFTKAADLEGRSKKHPKDITEMWKELDGKKQYPLLDLFYHGTVGDLTR